MRVFSQIHNSQSQFNHRLKAKPLYQSNFKDNHFEQSDMIIPAHDNSEQNAAQTKNPLKQKFKGQPEQFLQLNRQRYSSIINLPTHIKVQNQFEFKQQKTERKDPRGILKRQKIFDQSNFMTKKQKFIKQPQKTSWPIEKMRNEKGQTVRIGQSPKSIALRLLRSNSPINQAQYFEEDNNQNQINRHLQTNNASKRTSVQYDKPFNYQQMPTTLQVSRDLQISRESQIQNIINEYPTLVERLQANEKEIGLLRNKLNTKINNDAEKQKHFYQMYSHKSNNTQTSLKSMPFKKQNTEHSEKELKKSLCLDMKRTIKIEDSQRQNNQKTNNYIRHSSIIEQKPYPTEYMIIQNRIQQLRRMRRLQSQSIANSKVVQKYNNFDVSTRSPQYFQQNQRRNYKELKCRMPQNIQLLDQDKIMNSHAIYRQTKSKLANTLKIETMVPVSKIY